MTTERIDASRLTYTSVPLATSVTSLDNIPVDTSTGQKKASFSALVSSVAEAVAPTIRSLTLRAVETFEAGEYQTTYQLSFIPVADDTIMVFVGGLYEAGATRSGAVVTLPFAPIVGTSVTIGVFTAPRQLEGDFVGKALGSGLADSGTAISVDFAGTGSTATVARSDHTHANATVDTPGFMTGDEKAKLAGIAAGAQVNVATNLTISVSDTAATLNSSTGTGAEIPVASTSIGGLLSASDKTKLDGIEASADANPAAATTQEVEDGLVTSGRTFTPAQLKLAAETHAPSASAMSDGEVTTGTATTPKTLTAAQLKLGVETHAPSASAMSNGEVTTGTATDPKTVTAAQLKLAAETHGGNLKPTLNTSTTKKFLTQTGDGTTAGTPTFEVIGTSDLPDIIKAAGQNTILGRVASGSGAMSALSATDATTVLNEATTSLKGLMSSADKLKLNGIAEGAQVNVATNLSASTTATTVTVVSSTGDDASIGAATQSAAGAMSAADKTKLDTSLVPDGFETFLSGNWLLTDGSTRVVTVKGTSPYYYWIGGTRYSVSADKTVTLTDSPALYYISVNSSGNLVASTSHWADSPQGAPVAATYYNSSGIISIDGRAPHTRSSFLAAQDRFLTGAWVKSGFGTPTVGANDGSISLPDGVFVWNGREFTPGAAVTQTQTVRRNSTGWIAATQSSDCRPSNGTALSYDSGTGLTAATETYYVNAWLFAIPAGTSNPVFRVQAVVGQAQHAALSGAQDEALSGLTVPPWIALSGRPLWRLTFRRTSSYALGEFIQATDLRAIQYANGVVIQAGTGGSGGGAATNLTTSYTTTTVGVGSSTGSGATIAAATTTEAGVLTAADKQKLDSVLPEDQWKARINIVVGDTASTTRAGTVDTAFYNRGSSQGFRGIGSLKGVTEARCFVETTASHATTFAYFEWSLNGGSTWVLDNGSTSASVANAKAGSYGISLATGQGTRTFTVPDAIKNAGHDLRVRVAFYDTASTTGTLVLNRAEVQVKNDVISVTGTAVDFAGFSQSVPSNTVVYMHLATIPCVVTNVGSLAYAYVAPTNSVVMTVRKNSTDIGQITFSANTSVGQVAISTTSLANGDRLAIIAPSNTYSMSGFAHVFSAVAT